MLALMAMQWWKFTIFVGLTKSMGKEGREMRQHRVSDREKTAYFFVLLYPFGFFLDWYFVCLL